MPELTDADVHRAFDELLADLPPGRPAPEVLARARSANRRRRAGRGAILPIVAVIVGVVLMTRPSEPIQVDVAPGSSSPPGPALTTTAPMTTSTPRVASTDLGDWEAGLRWDYGRAAAVDPSLTWLSFDRVSVTWDNIEVGPKPPIRPLDGLVSGTRWVGEYVVFGNTDTADVNESTRLRRYRLTPATRVLHLRAGSARCAWEDGPDRDPIWDRLSLADLRALLVATDAQAGQTALTFSPDGTLEQVRVSYGC